MAHTDQIAQASELLNGVVRTMTNFKEVMNFQVLSNLDHLEEAIKSMQCLDQDSKVRLLTMVRDSVKEPVRRQVGRIPAQLEAIRSVREKIQRVGEELTKQEKT